jgi:hypothetical protein
LCSHVRNEVSLKICELSQHMEEQFDAQRDLDAELREREAKQLEEFRNKVRLPIMNLFSSAQLICLCGFVPNVLDANFFTNYLN